MPSTGIARVSPRRAPPSRCCSSAARPARSPRSARARRPSRPRWRPTWDSPSPTCRGTRSATASASSPRRSDSSSATLGKLARDLALLAQSEVGEAFEAAAPGRGGSSTMPQKRNPVAAAIALAAATRVPALVATMLAAAVQEHERGLGNWPAEWETLPEIVLLAAGALDAMADAVAGLEVDAARMQANLDLTQGQLLAEAVQMALAPALGRDTAHALVADACRRATAQRRHLRDVLADDAKVGAVLDDAALRGLFEPASYLGAERRVHRPRARPLRAEGSLMPFADLAEVRLHYRLDGPEGAPVLVLSNSLGTDLDMWEAQMAALTAHCRVLRYDTRGHGQSSVPPGPYTIAQLGRDVVALLDHLALERVDFAGVSMGGMTGMWLGVHVPERIGKLTLANTAARIAPPDLWNARIEKVNAGGMAAISDAVLAPLVHAGLRGARARDASRR